MSSPETEHYGADCLLTSRAELSGQKHRALGFAAAGECEDFRRSGESKPAGPVLRPDTVTGISKDAGTISSDFRGTELWGASFRPDSLAQVSSSAGHGTREQCGTPFDTVTG